MITRIRGVFTAPYCSITICIISVFRIIIRQLFVLYTLKINTFYVKSSIPTSDVICEVQCHKLGSSINVIWEVICPLGSSMSFGKFKVIWEVQCHLISSMVLLTCGAAGAYRASIFAGLEPVLAVQRTHDRTAHWRMTCLGTFSQAAEPVVVASASSVDEFLAAARLGDVEPPRHDS